ncbi:MAG TPA: 2OG-Fe(II) oxygenase family protein [Streptosporangiaceae bacterium]|nr:2OG-Fe(II) oxygenase family protein [Streptosporangiaceae bacterium]
MTESAMLMSRLSARLPAAMARAALDPSPWPHAYLADVLPADVALRLSRSFGRFDMDSCEETRRAKSYRFRTTRLDRADPAQVAGTAWMPVIEVLSAPEYRSAISTLTGVRLDDADVTLSLWEYQAGDWLAPHVDKPDKLVTQIFYLTEGWREGDGGRLLIMKTADPSSVVRVLPPRLGSSAVLVTSGTSWHAVEAPRPGAAGRRSITVTFWRT